MAAQVLPIEFVISDPEIRGGQPIIAGTTLRVSDLASWHTLAGLTPEQLASQFDLDLARVHAALAYYYHHKAAVDAEIRANAEQAEIWRQRLMSQGSGVALGAGLASWSGGKPRGSDHPAKPRGKSTADIVLEDRR
jgi:uncharacterized protein (DUF433 family)